MENFVNIEEISKNFLHVAPGVKLSKNIYLIYPDVNSWHGLPYHSGLASISAVLKNNGYNVKVKYFSSENQYAEIINEIIEFQPSVVGFTTVETQFGYVQELAALVKEKYACVTVVGGTHITLWPQALLEKGSVGLDCGMRGECEDPFVDLIKKIEKSEDYHGVDNICYRDFKTGGLVQNPLRPLVQNMETLPHPATEVFDFQNIIDENQVALFHFNRGCPYPCTYCSAQNLALQYGKVKDGMRHRPVDNAIEEIKLTLEKYNVPQDTLLLFTDDLFTLNKEWLYEFLPRYEAEIGRPFWSTARSNTASAEQFDRLKSAGADTIMMAIESGNDFIRNKVMKRNISRKVMFRSFELADRYGLKTCSPCVIGVPGETPEHIEDSLDTVAQLNVTSKEANIFYPYQGTPLRVTCDENGFLPDIFQSGVKERRDSVLNLPTITKEEIKYYHKNWESLLYKRMGIRKNLGFQVKDFYHKVTDNPLGQKAKHFINHNKRTKKLKEGVMTALGVS
jgi:anaerobic magnesium-protoporphyrin IX monomethyl ester cyclase